MDDGQDKEKRIRSIRKKLQQIEKLKEKGGDLDADAKEKVATEPGLLHELALLEGKAPPERVAAPVAAKKAPVAAAPAASKVELPAEDLDVHAAARAKALEPCPGDMGLLLDDETEKRFKALQKKLRDIGKLHEKKDSLDKLQKEKLLGEPALIEEIETLRAKATAVLETRRQARQAELAAPKEARASKPRSGPSWECPNCGKSGSIEDLDGSDGAACPHCGYDGICHYSPETQQDEGDEDEEAEEEKAKTKKTWDSKDLKTGRQKKEAGSPVKQKAEVSVSSGSARWPEVKEVLESGDGGIDKGRQKKAIAVDKAKAEAPYDAFDSVLLKCNFLTRVELKLPPGVLASEGFMLYFPGTLAESLVELILKENQLPAVPPGVGELARVRSIDLSFNSIDSLGAPEMWHSIASTLELLDLSFNQLESIEALEPLTKLSQLKVDGNKLKSLSGVSWKELKQLTTMSAARNQLTEIPEELGMHAASLENLELSENKITVLPTNLSDLKKLKAFELMGNPIKDQKALKAAEKGVKDLKTYLGKLKPSGKK